MNPRIYADMRGSSRELQEDTFVETVALSIARVLPGGAGFLLELACVEPRPQHIQLSSFAHPLTLRCIDSTACLGTATDLRRQLSKCIKLLMASRLREDLVQHVCNASTRCENDNTTQCYTSRHDACYMCLHHSRLMSGIAGVTFPALRRTLARCRCFPVF